MDLINLVAIVIFSGASITFAIAEASLLSLSKWQINQLIETDPQKGRIIETILSTPEELLGTIALGNTFSNAIILAIIITNYYIIISPIITILGVLFWVLIVCEIFPKTIAVRSPLKWSLQVAGFISNVIKFSKPIHKLTERVKGISEKVLSGYFHYSSHILTDVEYREMIEIAFQQGAVGYSEKEIILKIIALDKRMAHEVMRPRSEMACISDDATIEEMIAAAKKYKFRRIPIYDESPDTIVGILNARELLLNPNADLSEVVEMPSFVPSTMNLLKLFKSFQKQKRGIAIVLDEFGNTVGIITISDILEEVIGRFAREGEPAGLVIEQIGNKKWRVSGTARIEDFQRHCSDFKADADVDTIGGIVVAKLEVVPPEGSSVLLNGYKLTVLKSDERRVYEVLIEKIAN